MDADYANRLRWFRQFKEHVHASTSTLIVGIDIGKDTHHAFLGTPAGRTIHRRLIFENSIYGFDRLLFLIKQKMSEKQLSEVVIGVEPTLNIAPGQFESLIEGIRLPPVRFEVQDQTSTVFFPQGKQELS